MSAFTESALLKKLQELNSSQQSIQTVSFWLIHHRKHHSAIVRTWYRELLAAPEPKKLTFMYLANDVIQNSKKKGPEFGREFSSSLLKVFAHIGETCKSDKLFGSLSRILKIWEERFVYDHKIIAEYRRRLNRENNSTTEATEKLSNGSDRVDSKEKEKSLEKPEKRKSDEIKVKSKRARTSSTSEEKKKLTDANGGESVASEITVTASPHIPLGDPPEPDELIKALIEMENAASSDAVIRERIANLPPEISEISCLSKLEDKEAAIKLSTQVNEASELLKDYNVKLALEMEKRNKLTSMLRDFLAEQKELQAQAEQRQEEILGKLEKMKTVQKEIRDHLSNLPDLTSLPDVTGGLAPLPSAGDLFNIH